MAGRVTRRRVTRRRVTRRRVTALAPGRVCRRRARAARHPTRTSRIFLRRVVSMGRPARRPGQVGGGAPGRPIGPLSHAGPSVDFGDMSGSRRLQACQIIDNTHLTTTPHVTPRRAGIRAAPASAPRRMSRRAACHAAPRRHPRRAGIRAAPHVTPRRAGIRAACPTRPSRPVPRARLTCDHAQHLSCPSDHRRFARRP
jgi:hypothetical protein